MPKERRTRSTSFGGRSRASPFPCSSSSGCHRHSSSSSSSSRNPPESPVPAAKDIKEWEEARCPVCMEHPHNAVLLVCSSRDKGCQPFMCDTSYRHSNCLDQYRKAFSGSPSLQVNGGDQQPSKLSCPLCRGDVTGWLVLEPARRYMNSKVRCCSTESCGFTGAYGELRKHARMQHPTVRPSEADPERQQDWRRMERQRDLGDLFSTMQSAMGGEDGELGSILEEDEDLGSIFPFPSITLLFVLRFRGPGGMGTERTSVRYSRSLSRVSSRSRRGRATILWGETFNEPEAESAVRVDRIGNGGGDNDVDDNGVVNYDGGSDEVSATSRRGRDRPRRQLRMSDDDDDEDIDDDLL